ncbi:GumC family protein [Echinicola salinicaeni]|uniref:GumC family protein n=1 Tax=Echinicola salinicaeni TaxID=2762757 RepID=UPI00164643F3|nr:tyrosine-protein kinase [Echinicola salinicaeni]
MKLIPKNTSEDYLEEAEVQSFNMKDYFLRYLKYWPYFLISIVIALAAAFIANKFVAPQYKVESKFLIKDDNPNTGILDLTGLATGRRYAPNQLSNESITMKSKPMARGTLERLDFDVEYYSTDQQIPIEIYNNAPFEVEVDWEHSQLTGAYINITWDNPDSYILELSEDIYYKYNPETGRTIEYPSPFIKMKAFPFGKWLEVADLKIKISHKENQQLPTGEYIIKLRSLNSLVSQYTGDNLQVFPMDPTASILGLSLITKNSQKGIDYLNQLMDIYLEYELEEKNKLASNTVDFIDNQIAGVSDSLGFIENRLQNFRSSHKTYNIGSEGSAMFERISELESTLAQHKFKKEYYQNLQDYLTRENYNEIVMPSGLGIEDPILNTLIENLITLQSDKSRLLVTLTEASPSVKEVNKKIRDLNGSIREVITNAGKNTDQVILDLQNRIVKLESEFSKLPFTEQNLLRIQRQFAINESIYTFLLQRRAESAISLASNTTTNKVVEYAGPGSIPITLPYLTNYILAIIAGLMIPFAAITLIYMFNQNIKDLKDAEKKLSVPVLTHIGKNKYKSNLVVLNEPQSGITEAFRALKTNIHFISPKEKQVTIALTSSISGEGKTFCAINLASTFSLNNKKTILVGCDMRKPKIFGDFEINNDAGLSTYLSMQSHDLSSVIQSTKYENLDILVAGPIPPNPSELLVSNHFELLIRELQTKYDVVILDTPPLGLVSETLEILQLVDLTLFMIRYNYSKIPFISEINKLKNKIGQPHLYAVFNDVADKELTYGGYGYGYYKEDQKKSLIDKIIGKSSRNVGL